MNYKGVKVLYINPTVYLGEDFKNNDWRDNQRIFKEKIKNLNFGVGFGYECPIDDLIDIQVDYEDNLEPLAKMDTIDKIFSVTNELLKVFGDNVKMNLYLDNYIKDEGNSIDMTITKFVQWLLEELNRYKTTKI